MTLKILDFASMSAKLAPKWPSFGFLNAMQWGILIHGVIPARVTGPALQGSLDRRLGIGAIVGVVRIPAGETFLR